MGFAVTVIYIIFFILQIEMLEEQKSSIRHNLDSLLELAMERDICASEKFEEVIVIEDHLAEPLLGL